ncbi:alanine racemase [Brevibacterium daeguense]|nr:alanine racemase [Brevibacterium daeguense]
MATQHSETAGSAAGPAGASAHPTTGANQELPRGGPEHSRLPTAATVILGPQHKSIPPALWGRPGSQVGTERLPLSTFPTPLFTLSDTAISRNLELMSRYARDSGVLLAPHGKTTMSPDLWHRQLDAGCWGISVATPWQAQIARHAGVQTIVLANTLLDPTGIAWVAQEMRADRGFRFVCWVDSPAGVQLLDRVLTDAGAERPLEVIVEVGGPDGRAGVRSQHDGIAVAEAVAASRHLRLLGVGGYEGVFAHDRSADDVQRVTDYLAGVTELHAQLVGQGLYPGQALLTAGGSMYFDLVVDAFTDAARTATAQGVSTSVLLRSGAYLIHDSGTYDEVSALGSLHAAEALAPGMHVFSRVLSRPEPGLAILDAGKRDVPFDYGLPVPLRVLGDASPETEQALAAATMRTLNDQHLFLDLPAGTSAAALPVGAVVQLGLSHPCTAFDKWRLVTTVDDATSEEPHVTGFLPTYF